MRPRYRPRWSFQTKLTVFLIALSGTVLLYGVFLLYNLAARSLREEFRHKLLAVACSTAAGINVADNEQVRVPADGESATYLRLRKQLEAVRRANRVNRVSDVYTMRLDHGAPVYVVDSYPPGTRTTDFAAGLTDPPPAVGDPEDNPTPEMRAAFHLRAPIAETQPSRDKWGVWLSGYAPLFDTAGRQVGIVGVDASADTLGVLTHDLRIGTLQGLACALVLSIALGALISRRITRPVSQLTEGLRSVSEGDLTAHLELHSGDEFEEFAKTFNLMVVGLREREQLKNVLVRHLSSAVAESILNNPEALQLGGQKVQATVLFADIRDFTQKSTGMVPIEIVGTLNEYFGVIVDVILRHEGTLDKFLGDGLMAVFGAPLAQPDHPARALRCALEIQEAVAGLNRERAQLGLIQFELGVGLNSGEVVAGQVGSHRRMEYTVIGTEVNRAFRIQRLAGPGEVLVSSTLRPCIPEYLDLEPLGPVALRGMGEAETLYRVAVPRSRAA
jgi:adenylate cyclase